jgi:lysophospholipase L1-like esterase
VFPRSAKGGNQLKDREKISSEELMPKVKEVNTRIAKLDDGTRVFYLDIGGEFLDKDGGLAKAVMPDYLHLSAKGYQAWADAIKGKLGELMK